MCCEFELRLEHDKFLGEAFRLRAQKVILAKVLFQRIVVGVVLKVMSSSFAEMACLVCRFHVRKQLIVVVVLLSAKLARWMALECG